MGVITREENTVLVVMDKDEKVLIDRVMMFSQNQVYEIAQPLSDSHSKEVRNAISGSNAQRANVQC